MVRGFAKLRFQGSRFDGPQFPVEALSELVAYQELVLEAAKELWRGENPDRVNVPRGLDASFTLMLTTVEDGSSMPVLVQAAIVAGAIQGMPPDEADTLFDRGRELVEKIVNTAATSGALPNYVSSTLSHRFTTFGSKLQPGERVVLQGPLGSNSGPGATLDYDVRLRILEALPSSAFADVELLGEIVRADKPKHMFELREHSSGRRYNFVVEPAMSAELLTWMRDDTVVRLRGQVTLERTPNGAYRLEVAKAEALQQDLDVAVSGPCPLPIAVQLADISRLQDGWLDGEGSAYKQATLSKAQVLFEQLLVLSHVDMPYVYPTADGALRAEWNHPVLDVVVTLESTLRTMRLLVVDSSGQTGPMKQSYEVDEAGLRNLSSILGNMLYREDDL